MLLRFVFNKWCYINIFTDWLIVLCKQLRCTVSKTRWWLRLRQLLCLRQHETSQKVHFKAYLTASWPWPLTFQPWNLMHSSLSQSPLVVKVWSNSINKYSRHLANNVCLELMHVCSNAWTLWNHNASSYYVGGDIKNYTLRRCLMFLH